MTPEWLASPEGSNWNEMRNQLKAKEKLYEKQHFEATLTENFEGASRAHNRLGHIRNALFKLHDEAPSEE